MPHFGKYLKVNISKSMSQSAQEAATNLTCAHFQLSQSSHVCLCISPHAVICCRHL